MTFLRLTELNKHWGKHPPMNVMVQAFMGFKADNPKQEQDGAAFFGQMG